MAAPNYTVAAVECEIGLVGAMLLDQTKIAQIVDICSGKDYSNHDLGHIHDVVVSLWASGTEIEPGIVASKVPAGMADTAMTCYSSVGTAVNAVYYARLIRDAALRRRIVVEARSIAKSAREDGRDTDSVLADVQGRLLRLVGAEDEPTLSDTLDEVERDSDRAAEMKSHVVGVPFGFRALDLLTGGLSGGDMIVVACRPSVGKTSIATDVIRNLLTNTDQGCIMFSAEMRRQAIARRMISVVAGVDNLKIRTGNLTGGERELCRDASAEIKRMAAGRFILDDRPSPTIAYMTSKVMQRKSDTRIDLVVIDQFSKLASEGRYDGTVSMLSARATAIKAMAQKLDLPVMLLHQLNRGAEGEAEMRVPVLSDLKSTGTLEEDADTVILLHRLTRTAEFGEIILAKQRDGETGSTGSYRYSGPLTSWKEMS